MHGGEEGDKPKKRSGHFGFGLCCLFFCPKKGFGGQLAQPSGIQAWQPYNGRVAVSATGVKVEMALLLRQLFLSCPFSLCLESLKL